MKKPPFRWFFAAAFVAAVLVALLPLWIGGPHNYVKPAVPLAFAWLALFAAGLVLYRRFADQGQAFCPQATQRCDIGEQ